MKAAAGLLKVARKYKGVVTRELLLAGGVTEHQVDDAIAEGVVSRLRPGTYLVAPTPLGWEQKLQAAILATHPHGAVAGLAAAALLHFDGFERGPVELILPQEHQFRARWVKVTRSRDFDPARDTWRVNGFPVTRVGRTLLDLSTRCTEEQLIFAIESMLRRRRSLLLQARDYLCERSQGRRGVRRLIELLAERVDLPPTDDRYEVLAELLMRKRGLYPLRQQQVFDSNGRLLGLPDFLFRDEKLVVEVDGDKTHLQEKKHRKDRIRDTDFQAEHYFVFRTWPKELTDTPGRFLDRLEKSLASRPRPMCAPFGQPEQLLLLAPEVTGEVRTSLDPD